jgi:hypothetical protein
VSGGESENVAVDFVVVAVVTDFWRGTDDRRDTHRKRGSGDDVVVEEMQDYLFDHGLFHDLVAGTWTANANDGKGVVIGKEIDVGHDLGEIKDMIVVEVGFVLLVVIELVHLG